MATVAVVMGIEYVAYAAAGRIARLGGCHEDATRVHAWLTAGEMCVSSSNMAFLSDEPGCAHAPTAKNVCAALRWLAHRATLPEVARCLIYYSGHGTRQEGPPSAKPKNKTSKTNPVAIRPCLVPCDYEESGVVDQKALRAYLCALPKGCTLIFLTDACHAGTLFGLPAVKIYRGAPSVTIPRRAKKTRKKALKRKRPVQETQTEENLGEMRNAEVILADNAHPACAFFGISSCTETEVSHLFANLPNAERDMSLFTWALLACATEQHLRNAHLPLDALLQAAQDRISGLIGEQHITLTASADWPEFCIVAKS